MNKTLLQEQKTFQMAVDTGRKAYYIAASRHRAQMAELVDALASGASVRMDVEVRVLFWAPLSPSYLDETERKQVSSLFLGPFTGPLSGPL